MNMIRPDNVTTLCIQLESMSQLAEAISKEDDWTGTKDAVARRRAQTRLNTRAYRKRKVMKEQSKGSITGAISLPVNTGGEVLVECWNIKQQSISTIPAPHIKNIFNQKDPLLPEKHKKEGSFMFPLCPDHLIILLQFNALRAMAINRSLISGILSTPLDCDEERFHTVPCPTNPEQLPATLFPTILQQTVPHGDWIDLFPSPEGRDRLIQASGSFDENELWDDCIGGLYQGFPDDEIERRGIIAWSPCWSITGWEMSEGFLRKWGWLFDGLPEVLEATNCWRMVRGEEPFLRL